MSASSPQPSAAHTDSSISGEVLVHALASYDVPFLAGEEGSRESDEERLTPATLMSALVTHPDPRLRLALIPLLVRHPRFSQEAERVADQLPAMVRAYFQCFYTAARLLQTIHQAELELYLGKQPPLPDLFGAALDLPEDSPEETLRVLGERQQQLLGRCEKPLGLPLGSGVAHRTAIAVGGVVVQGFFIPFSGSGTLTESCAGANPPGCYEAEMSSA
ncbi:MAG: hypothetical protein H0T73_04760, partial [Ardenticatenales bacterium]|nr:hypothetical protein [Ardenticatenales bacterium]